PIVGGGPVTAPGGAPAPHGGLGQSHGDREYGDADACALEVGQGVAEFEPDALVVDEPEAGHGHHHLAQHIHTTDLPDVRLERIDLAEEARHVFQLVPVDSAREQAPHVAHHAVDGGGVLHDLLYAAHDVAGYVLEEAVDLVEDTVSRGRAVDAVQPADHCLEHVLHQQGPVAYQRLYH
ncbi:hypothetical protein JX266_014422, partial [Neoarthrinium moseri]